MASPRSGKVAAMSRRPKGKTCAKGHPWTVKNWLVDNRGTNRCLTCHRITNTLAARAYRKTPKGKAAGVKGNRLLRRRRKMKLLELFGGKCVDCGYAGHFAALEFDHLDATTKLFTIGASGTSKKWNQLVEEARKCEIVCSNCHAIRTYERHVKAREKKERHPIAFATTSTASNGGISGFVWISGGTAHVG